MTTVPFGTNIQTAAAPAPTAGATPTIVGVTGVLGTGATAEAGQLSLAHTKSDFLTLVGSDGELHDWGEQYYALDTGAVLIAPMASWTPGDDDDRDTKAIAALQLFGEDYGADGIRASLIDIGDYGTQVASGTETAASNIVAALETICEQIRALGFANYPAASADVPATWHQGMSTWAGNNRKPMVMACARTILTGQVSAGIAASTLLAAMRARIDGDQGITEPLGNKPVPGVVGAYPAPIAYSLNRNSASLGRTMQNTDGVSTVANYRGWKTVRAELAGAGFRVYESILRAINIAETRFEEAIASHMDGRNGEVERALLIQQLDTAASALAADQIIRRATWESLEAGFDS